jgi:putative MATE family efflux protein
MGVAWPLFVEQMLRALLLFVDQWMLSFVSNEAAAAVGVGANQVLFLCFILFNFVAVGASVVITHHLGAKDEAGAERIAAAAMGVNTWIGLAASAVVAGLAPFILRIQGVPGPMFPYARAFLGILGGTLFLDAQNLAMAAVLRAHGRTRDAMLVLSSVNLFNVAGNSLVLFAIIGRANLASHGVAAVAGVALSGVVARVIGFVALRLMVARRTGVWLKLRDYLRFPARELGRILHIGLPAVGENLAYYLSFMVVTSFVARLGPEPLIAFNYTRQVIGFVILLAVSVGLGTEIVVGHLVGAGEFDAAYHRLLRSLRTGVLLVGAGTVALVLARHQVFRIFTSDAAVLQGCATLMLFELIIEPGRVFNIVVINSLRATGDARFPVVMGACSMWLLFVPLSYVLTFHTPLGVAGAWIAMACDEWLRGIMMYLRWRGRGWLKYARESREHVSTLTSPDPVEPA